MDRHSPILLLLCGALASATASADGWWDSLQIHGFAAQALVHTSANRFYGDSPNTSFDFTELGFAASLRLNPRALLAGQLLARRAGAMHDGTPAIDFALADLMLLSSAERRLGVRLGRIKNPLGLYNETRDVPFTRPGIFLPQVIYFDKVRNLVLSSDGLMFYGDLYRDFGALSLTLGGGYSVIDENVETAYLFADHDGTLDQNGNSWTGSLWYASPAERLKLGLSGALLRLDFDPKNDRPVPLAAGTIDMLYWIGSFQYNAEHWTLSAEYARRPLEWRDFGPAIPFDRIAGEGYYLQGTYRLRPNWELMLRYEEGFADRADRDGAKLAALTGGQVPRQVAGSKTLSAGLRWDIDRNWMLRAELQVHDGTFILAERENPELDEHRRYWQLFALQAAFRF